MQSPMALVGPGCGPGKGSGQAPPLWARASDERVALGALGPVVEPREKVPRRPLPGPCSCSGSQGPGGGAPAREEVVGTRLLLRLG